MEVVKDCEFYKGLAEAIETYMKYRNPDDDEPFVFRMSRSGTEALLRLLKEQKQIVQCKDCKYASDYSSMYYVRPYRCEKHDWFRDANWFCADGERR